MTKGLEIGDKTMKDNKDIQNDFLSGKRSDHDIMMRMAILACFIFETSERKLNKRQTKIVQDFKDKLKQLSEYVIDRERATA